MRTNSPKQPGYLQYRNLLKSWVRQSEVSFFSMFASQRWSPPRMRTKVVSFFPVDFFVDYLLKNFSILTFNVDSQNVSDCWTPSIQCRYWRQASPTNEFISAWVAPDLWFQYPTTCHLSILNRLPMPQCSKRQFKVLKNTKVLTEA